MAVFQSLREILGDKKRNNLVAIRRKEKFSLWRLHLKRKIRNRAGGLEISVILGRPRLSQKD